MTINIPKPAFRALQRNQWIRNGKYPDANGYSILTNDLNHACRFLTKELFTFTGVLNTTGAASDIPNANGTRTRWRSYCHLGPFVRYLRCSTIQALCTGGFGPGSQCRSKLIVKKTDGTVLGNVSLWYGDTLGSPTDIPSNLGGLSGVVCYEDTDTPFDFNVEGYFDIDVTLEWQDVNSRLVSASVFEESVASDNTDVPYAPDAYTLYQPILNSHRSTLISNASSMWKRGAAHLISWSVDQDALARTRSPAAGLNVVDGTSTTVSASTPGWTIDLANRSTIRRGTVPCVFAAYLKMSGGGTGAVVLKDSSGTVKATCSTSSSTAAWVTTTCNLSAASGKYDIQISGDGINTCTAYAAALFQYA